MYLSMMISFIILLLALVLISIQDFHSRTMYWFLPIVVFIASVVDRISYDSFLSLGIVIALNWCFLVLQFIFVWLYFSIKHRRYLNIFDHYIGWGDVAFFFSVAPLFSLVNYFVFVLLSLFVALIGSAVITFFSSKYSKHIPLAGISACCLFVLLLTQLSVPQINLADDTYLFLLV